MACTICEKIQGANNFFCPTLMYTYITINIPEITGMNSLKDVPKRFSDPDVLYATFCILSPNMRIFNYRKKLMNKEAKVRR